MKDNPILAIYGLPVKPQINSRIWQHRTMKRKSVEQTISDNLKRLMERNPHLGSQTKIAERSGVGQSTVGRILRNSGGSPTVETVSDIARAFGITFEDLINPALFGPQAVKEERATYMTDDEAELLAIFKSLPRSGRLAVLARAHREREQHGSKQKGVGGGEKQTA